MQLRHHNPKARLNSWDERAERWFFLMMGWRDLKKPGAGALPLCAVTQLAKSVQEVTESKSEQGNRRSCHEGGGQQRAAQTSAPKFHLLSLLLPPLCTLLLDKRALDMDFYVIQEVVFGVLNICGSWKHDRIPKLPDRPTQTDR